MESDRIDELVIAARQAAFLADPTETIDRISAALADTTDSEAIGQLLFARALAAQGSADIAPAADDAAASIPHFRQAGELGLAAFAAAAAAGMAGRTSDIATSVDLAVEAMVLIGQAELDDTIAVRTHNALAVLFAQLSAFELALASSRRAVEGARASVDLKTTSAAAYTMGYCAVEAIRAGFIGWTDADSPFNDLDLAIEWLEDSERDPVERVVLGGGMAAERVLLSGELISEEILKAAEEATSLYDQTALRLAAWHRLVFASLLRRVGLAESAEHLLDEAIPELINAGDEHRVVRAYRERAEARAVQGNLAGAYADTRELSMLTRLWHQEQVGRLAGQISLRADSELSRARLRTKAEKLALEASEDMITGLGTRRWLEVKLDEFALRSGEGAVVIIDIDHFKRVNDTFGHQVGDEVLRKVGSTIRDVVRSNDPVARYGGEEFVMLMAGTDQANAVRRAEDLRRTLKAVDWDEIAPNLELTVSAGVSHGPLREIRDRLRLADAALYEAKRAGRNQVMAS